MGVPSDTSIKMNSREHSAQSEIDRKAGKTDMRRDSGGVATAVRRVDGSPKSRRRMSAPELPPIGVKPNSPGYSPRMGEQTPAYANKKGEARKRPSPLSPTSTATSAAGLSRTNSWLAASELSNSMSANRLETLFEGMDGGQRISEINASNNNTKGNDKNDVVIWSLGEVPISSNKPPISRSKISIDSTLASLKSRSPLDDNRNVLSKTLSAPAAVQHPAVQLPQQPPAALTSRLSQENLSSLSRNSNNSPSERFDADKDKDDRIMEWLVGVKTSSSSAGGIPEITPIETAEKRDTAIHIVYNGD